MIFEASDTVEIEVSADIDVHKSDIVLDVIQISKVAVPGFQVPEISTVLDPFEVIDIWVVTDVDLYQVGKVIDDAYTVDVAFVSLDVFDHT